MRKRIGTGFLAFLMLTMVMIPAMAATKPTDTENSGIWDLKFTGGAAVETGTALENDTYKIEPLTKNDAAVTASAGFFGGAEKLRVTVKNAAATGYYLIMAQDDTSVPTSENLVYIDQKTGTEPFEVYPKSLVADKTYFIYVTTNLASGERTPIASFTFYAPYMLGNVWDKDQVIDGLDAMEAMKYWAKMTTLTETQKLSGDVWPVVPDGVIDGLDAMEIMKFWAKMPSSLDGR